MTQLKFGSQQRSMILKSEIRSHVGVVAAALEIASIVWCE